ncbi:DUF1641 domain-containing protein [Aneurinibacillus tyrosinisolvens]|uniref:DUF1641 domain-containing protein n=1 Tax=Aneurinibacillus tyrosinisolvens TaxID=1443435 RepID=UPI00063F2683|nr:DUF1641 domain-containing protein [Aneurinibacillus tyrosinisolvens]
MARAITRVEKRIPTQAQRQEESFGDILRVLSENRESVVAFLDIMKELHQSGLFDIVQGVLKNKHEIGKVGFEFIQVAGIPSMLKNGIVAMQFLSKLDPLKVQMILSGLSNGLEKATSEEDSHTSVWGIVKALRDPEINTTVTSLLGFLRGMGEELNKDKAEVKRDIHEK